MFGLDLSPTLNAAANISPLLSSSRNRLYGGYANPFLNQAQHYIPRNIKLLMKFARNMYLTDPLIHSVLSKSESYIITDILYNPSDESKLSGESQKKSIRAWKNAMDNEIRVRSLLKGMTRDWQVYGNSFVLPLAIRRFSYVCTGKCGRAFSPDFDGIKFKGFNSATKSLRHQCFKCGTVDLSIVYARGAASVESVRAVRLNPENIKIENNPLNGECTYRYSIPERVRQQIREGNPDYLRDLPPRFVAAANQEGAMEFRKGRLFHFAEPGLAEEDMGWGKPPILCVLQDVFHMKVTQRSEEQILTEHLVPLRILFPSATNGMNPIENLNMEDWESQLTQWLQVWKQDQNAIPISTTAVGVANIGGDAKALLATPNLQEFYSHRIISGLEVPREFVDGGLSFSSSSMSIRMVQNKFDSTRVSVLEGLNFIKDFVRVVKGFDDVSLDFSSLKLADDVSKTNQMLQLASQSKVSWKTTLTNLGIDYEGERKQILLELKEDNEIRTLEARAAADSSAEAEVIAAKGNARAQYENQRAIEELQEKERARAIIDAQIKRRASMTAMPDEVLMQYLQTGNGSISDILFLTNQGRIPIAFMPELSMVAKQIQEQILTQFGINPATLEGLPPDLALMIGNNVLPPNEIGKILSDMQQQAMAEQQQQQAQQEAEQPAAQPSGPPKAAKPTAEDRGREIASRLQGAGSQQERSLAESDARSQDPEGYQIAMKYIGNANKAAPEKPGTDDGSST